VKLPPGQDLDELVLNAVRKRRSVGEAICVPYGPEGHPLGWAVASSSSGPMQHGGEVLRVFVKRCECPRKTFREGLRSGGERVAGHGIGCLDPVPKYSLEEMAALPLLRRFDKFDLQKDVIKGKERWTLTVYEPGVYVDGESLPHVISLAVVEAARCRAL
jgi:hypothetical protein